MPIPTYWPTYCTRNNKYYKTHIRNNEQSFKDNTNRLKEQITVDKLKLTFLSIVGFTRGLC